MDEYAPGYVKCCANCIWRKDYEEEYQGVDVKSECRRFPPQVYGGNGAQAYSTYPGVHLEEYCGEWEGGE